MLLMIFVIFSGPKVCAHCFACLTSLNGKGLALLSPFCVDHQPHPPVQSNCKIGFVGPP